MVINNLDFTLKTYKKFLNTLSNQGFSFSTFGEFVLNPHDRVFILRHDVDSLPGNSLQFAKIQAEKGTKGSYYFRTVPGSFDEKIIKEIYSLGHEVGYHYEDLSFGWAKLKAQSIGLRAQGEELEQKLIEIGILSFTKNLEKLRQIVPVKTICMHGSPMSRWDSRLLWKYYDYHDFGITGEPYFDVNFDEVLYLTDTGRRWDGDAVSVRDKASGVGCQASGRRTQLDNPYRVWKVKPIKYRENNVISPSPPPSTSAALAKEAPPFSSSSLKFRSTFDIIHSVEKDILPGKIMMTFHPQRWTDKPLPWVKELVWQNVKNITKYFIVKVSSESRNPEYSG
jgi:hypothetical protein